MSYTNSEIDKKNINWFSNDNTRQSLTGISLTKGKMRGLTPFSLDLLYPITAIAGANGSGKSTILAMAACAFHNHSRGYCPAGRKHPYYTFSDFLIQSTGEVGPAGVEIAYTIRHNNWRFRDPGEARQVRRKPQGGKWNKYEQRVKRDVIYFGVQRVVPYYERTTHKSYRARFKPGNLAPETRTRIALLSGRILGKPYEDFESLEHSKYTLPKLRTGTMSYSGFNMGAGESAVLEILSTIFAAGGSCLLVIDEIELGLHESAQTRLIEVLKELCNELKCQIICTTHAYQVLTALPPEGRVYIEAMAGATQVFPGVSAEYACGKMGRSDPQELDIFVEDEVAKAIIHASLSHELRGRCRVLEIGSHGSLKRLMAARYMENRRSCLCLLDGDQRSGFEKAKNDIAKLCDGKFTAQGEEIRNWAASRVDYFPGKEWPEKWLLERAIDLCGDVLNDWSNSPARAWGVQHDGALLALLTQALAAGKHKEFPSLAGALSLTEDTVRRELIAALRATIPSEFDGLANRVQKLLP